MSCHVVTGSLASGLGLNAEARAHLESCNSCRSLIASLQPSVAAPDSRLVAKMQNLLGSSIKPVRPLPSNGALTLLFFLAFAVFAIAAAAINRFAGAKQFSWQEMLPYYGTVFFCAALCARMLVPYMIPGAKRFLTAKLVVVGTLSAIAAVVWLTFPASVPAEFVQNGLSCFVFGSIAALIAGVLTWLGLRSGFITAPLNALAVTGSFGGLAGVAALALRCPRENSLHIITWHLGAMCAAGIAAYLIALSWQSKAPTR